LPTFAARWGLLGASEALAASAASAALAALDFLGGIVALMLGMD
jgi:hypothetical protein